MNRLIGFLIFCGFFVFGGFVVYDYKASFTRPDALMKSNSDGSCLLSLRNVKDSFTGVIIIEDCRETDCGDGIDGILYIQRKGDKLFDKMVWKLKVKMYNIFFGKSFYTCILNEQPLSYLKNANRTNVVLEYIIPDAISYGEDYITKDGSCNIIYGFLGWSCYTGYIKSSGYGGSFLSGEYNNIGFCGGGLNDACLMVKSASGQFVGEFSYCGVCGGLGAVNECLIEDVDAGINGNWAIRYNASKTKGLPKDISEIDEYALKLLKKKELFEPIE